METIATCGQIYALNITRSVRKYGNFIIADITRISRNFFYNIRPHKKIQESIELIWRITGRSYRHIRISARVVLSECLAYLIQYIYLPLHRSLIIIRISFCYFNHNVKNDRSTNAFNRFYAPDEVALRESI